MRATHVLLFGDGDAVDAEVGRGAEQARHHSAVCAVGAGAKFGEQVEDISRLRPVQRLEAAQLGAGVVGNQHRVGVDRERRLRSELVAPQPPGLAAAQILRHHADRPRPFAGAAGRCQSIVAAEFKFEVDGHDMAGMAGGRAWPIRRAAA